ncbi:MAG: hypothetical protein CL941_05770 [Desulfobacter sp.]|jgi:hypothetical protein|nr:hypothetical protein [Desulfobacter sp.]|tara:strand:- start:36112 stop:36465 length:354 start_codon:yes stop_codon:yes gene_type:complete
MLKNKCQFPGTPQDGYRKTGEGQFTASGEQGIQEKVVPSAAYALSAYWRSGCRLEFTALCQQCTQRLGGRRSGKTQYDNRYLLQRSQQHAIKKNTTSSCRKNWTGKAFQQQSLGCMG